MKTPFVDVTVASIDDHGFGVGATETRTIHVKGAAPGATGPVPRRARIVKRRGGHWYGVADPMLDGAAPCAAFPVCGGCAVQHLDASQQLAHKQRQVLRLLAAHGVVPTTVDEPVRGPLFHYRRRARLGVRHLAQDDETLVGFRESFGSRVARAENCLVLSEILHGALPRIKATLQRLDVRARVPQVELSAGDRAGALVLRHLAPVSGCDRRELAALEASTGLQVLLQASGQESVVRLDGARAALLDYRLDAFGVTLEFDPLDFVQVNARVNCLLVATAHAWLRPRAGERVVDLFCGIGNFTLPIARAGASVHGVEGSPSVVDRARRNAERNALGARAAFTAADLYSELDAPTLDAIACADAALVDPPRSGLGPIAGAIGRARVGRIVYVSCHPESFAADAAALSASGFGLERLSLFDMFPHTTHVETLALFLRR